MSSQKYRKLLTNLPSMAAVVNSFQSPDVQLEVYRLLVAELEEATEEPGGSTSASRSPQRVSRGDDSQSELAHALVDGDSIHVDDEVDT